MLVENLPHDCATSRSVHGPAAEWGVSEALLAEVIDVLAAANWQRAGDKNRPRPRPYPRPKSEQERLALGRRLKRLAKGGQS